MSDSFWTHELHHARSVHHQLLELAQIHVHQVSDAIWPTHALLSLFPLAFNLSLQALTRWNFVCKVITLLFNMLSRLVIAFLPRSKCLLISWLQSPSAVILEPKKIKYVTVSNVSPSISQEVIGPDAMTLVFWRLSFKLVFPLSFFTFIKRLFSSSSLSAIRVVSCAYLR